jgi:hypothetical protein
LTAKHASAPGPPAAVRQERCHWPENLVGDRNTEARPTFSEQPPFQSGLWIMMS